MRYLALSGDRALAHGRSPEGGPYGLPFFKTDSDERMGYDQWRDDFETWQKERFMYGELKDPLFKGKLDKAINAWLKKQYEKLVGKDEGTEGLATGGVSNLFRQRQGFRAGTALELVKGARWVIRMLKELADDMIFGRAQFAKMAEPEKIKLYKETQVAIKHLESGGPIPENLIQTMRKDPRFQNLTVSKGGDKDFVEIQEVVLESKFPQEMRKFMGKPLKTEDFVEIDLLEFKKTLPKDLLDKVNALPVEKQTNLLTVMKRAFDAA